MEQTRQNIKRSVTHYLMGKRLKIASSTGANKGHYSGGCGQSEQAIHHSKALVLGILNLLSETAEEFPLTRKKG